MQRSLPDIPILSYRRPKNLWGILVCARIKPDTPSNPTGSYKCHSQHNCITCQHITDSTTSFNFTNTDKNYDIKQRLDCNSTNVLYALQCKRCLTNGHKNCQYIGQTSRQLKDRFNEHRRDIINKKVDKSGVAEHFCSPEHTTNDLTVTLLLKLNNKRESVRRAKEQYLIGLANTLTPNGMNRTTDSLPYSNIIIISYYSTSSPLHFYPTTNTHPLSFAILPSSTTALHPHHSTSAKPTPPSPLLNV